MEQHSCNNLVAQFNLSSSPTFQYCLRFLGNLELHITILLSNVNLTNFRNRIKGKYNVIFFYLQNLIKNGETA